VDTILSQKNIIKINNDHVIKIKKMDKINIIIEMYQYIINHFLVDTILSQKNKIKFNNIHIINKKKMNKINIIIEMYQQDLYNRQITITNCKK